MSYKLNLQSQIDSVQNTIEKCQQMLSLKSNEPHIIEAWENVLSEAKENMQRLTNTRNMGCFFN